MKVVGFIFAFICCLTPLLWHLGQAWLPWLTAPWDNLALASAGWNQHPAANLPTTFLSGLTLSLPPSWLPFTLVAFANIFILWQQDNTRTLSKLLSIGIIGLFAAALNGPTDWTCPMSAWTGVAAAGLLRKQHRGPAKAASILSLCLTILTITYTAFALPSLAVGQSLALLIGAALGLFEQPSPEHASHEHTQRPPQH